MPRLRNERFRFLISLHYFWGEWYSRTSTIGHTLLEINLSARYWVRTEAISSIPDVESWSMSGRRLA
jgi:hypothetical protein